MADRPRPKPDGPVERYINRMLAAGVAAGAAAVPFAGPKRATALGLSALPKAPGSGREGYAAQLGRMLARRGVIAMDRSVLRELDRIDTLVLDAAVLGSDRGVLADLAPASDADVDQVAERAFALFDPDDPAASRTADGWRLGPLDRMPANDPDAIPDGGPAAHGRRPTPRPRPRRPARRTAAGRAGTRARRGRPARRRPTCRSAAGRCRR